MCGCRGTEHERVKVQVPDQRGLSILSMQEDTKAKLGTRLWGLWDSREVNDLQAFAGHCALPTNSQKNVRYQLGNSDILDLCIPSRASPPSEDSTSSRLPIHTV